MSESNAVRQTRAILLDAHTLATTITQAETNLDTAQAGWPTSTPGASPTETGPAPEGWCNEHPHPCPEHEHPDAGWGATCQRHPIPCRQHPTTASSIVERTAGHDKARADWDALREHIRKATHHTAAAAKLSQTWGTRGLNAADITNRLTAIDADIWCTHCVTYGHRNPRIETERHCSFCGDFKRNWLHKDTGAGIDPPKDLLDLWATKGRLYETDIIRILDRLNIKWKRPKRRTA